MAFIVITGGDKCGKTTQCKLLVDKLRNVKVGAVLLGVPDYESPVGETIRYLLQEGPPSDKRKLIHWQRSMEALHIIDKRLVAGKVREAQKQGAIVVCSRWFESAKVYAQANGFEEEWHDSLIHNLPYPDLTILLDITYATYRTRLESNGKEGIDKYEANFLMQQKVRELFRDEVENSSMWMVDGGKNQDEVANSVWGLVQHKLLAMAATASIPFDTFKAIADLAYRHNAHD
jgi:dTMP kinase